MLWDVVCRVRANPPFQRTDPLHAHVRDIVGGDSFQALCLASRLALDLLRSFVQAGGQLTIDGEPTFRLMLTFRQSRLDGCTSMQ
jgi:hypothetical protein